MHESRNGKHKKEKVRMGVYLMPFRKAVAMIVAQNMGLSMTDIIWEGIERLAKANGILTETGEVAEEYKDEFDVAMEVAKSSKVKG